MHQSYKCNRRACCMLCGPAFYAELWEGSLSGVSYTCFLVALHLELNAIWDTRFEMLPWHYFASIAMGKESLLKWCSNFSRMINLAGFIAQEMHVCCCVWLVCALYALWQARNHKHSEPNSSLCTCCSLLVVHVSWQILNLWRRAGLSLWNSSCSIKLNYTDFVNTACTRKIYCISFICSLISVVCLPSTMQWGFCVVFCCTFPLGSADTSHLSQVLSKRNTVFYGGDSVSMVDYMIWPWFERLEPFQLKEWVLCLASSVFWSASASIFLVYPAATGHSWGLLKKACIVLQFEGSILL